MDHKHLVSAGMLVSGFLGSMAFGYDLAVLLFGFAVFIKALDWS